MTSHRENEVDRERNQLPMTVWTQVEIKVLDQGFRAEVLDKWIQRSGMFTSLLKPVWIGFLLFTMQSILKNVPDIKILK